MAKTLQCDSALSSRAPAPTMFERDVMVERMAARRKVSELAAVVGRRGDDHGARRDRRDRSLRGMLQRIFESSMAGIVICDVHGNISEANASFLEMLGHRREELPLRWDRMTPPEWRDLDAAKVEEVLATGTGVAWEKEYVARGGHRVSVLVAVALLDRASGECLAIIHDISVRKRLEAQVREQREALRGLAVQAVLSEERERRRIAVGLHDDIGHALAMAKLRLGSLSGFVNGRAPVTTREAELTIKDIDDLIQQAIRKTRSLTFELGSPVLYELGIGAALESLGEEMQSRGQARFDVSVEPALPPMADDVAVVLYRTARELLGNATKHAGARRVSLAIGVGSRDDRAGSEIWMTVEDDGIGFDATDAGCGFGPDGGFGLFSIHEQLRHLGGRLAMTSHVGMGTRAILVVPISAVEGMTAPAPAGIEG